MRRIFIYAVLLGIIIATGTGYSYTTYAKGKLVIEIQDPPHHWNKASNIYIHYGEVKIHRANAGNETGWFTAVEGDGWIDLSEVLNTSKAIGTASMQAGKYNLIRFEIIESIISVDNKNYTATVANNKLNIAITKGGINIAAGQTTHLVIDITPKISGSWTTGYKLVPAAKAIPS